MSTETPSVNESDATTDEPMPAHRNDLAHVATETTRKRARWEALRAIPCPGTHRINVANESYADAGAHDAIATAMGTGDAPDESPTGRPGL